MWDVIVIGAGPAGMMAAYEAARGGAQVLLLEKKARPGRKLLITGKGRCNVTTAMDREGFMAAVPRHHRFLYAPLAQFDNDDVMAFFEGRGCPLKVERGARVFPASDRAADILEALLGALREAGVELRTEARVRYILPEEAGFTVGLDGAKLRTKTVILAVGGASYPGTGSEGDGYAMAKALGLSVIPPQPALVPLLTAPGWPQAAQGLSLRNVRLVIAGPKKKPLYDGFGEMLCTHFGLSGPLVLSASSRLVEHWAKGGGPLSGYVDLKPALAPEVLDQRLLREQEAQGKKQLSNAMKALLPKALVAPFLAEAGLDPERPLQSLTRSERRALGALMKQLPFEIVGTRPLAEAIVTAGGLDLKGFSSKNMGAKTLPGFYACGEVLDLDAETGGHNLLIAFSTGALAGRSAARRVREEEPCK